MSLVAHNRTGEPVLASRSPLPLRELFRAARSIHGLGAHRATQSHDMLDRSFDGRPRDDFRLDAQCVREEEEKPPPAAESKS